MFINNAPVRSVINNFWRNLGRNQWRKLMTSVTQLDREEIFSKLKFHRILNCQHGKSYFPRLVYALNEENPYRRSQLCIHFLYTLYFLNDFQLKRLYFSFFFSICPCITFKWDSYFHNFLFVRKDSLGICLHVCFIFFILFLFYFTDSNVVYNSNVIFVKIGKSSRIFNRIWMYAQDRI